ncbi:MAG: SatD family protein [Bacillota bacterium]
MFFNLNHKLYIAMIGDIVQSKELENRKECQDKLMTVLDSINKKYTESIASKFMITLGDEFQGLLKNGADTMRIISDIEIKMFPVKIRFGIGIGRITTDINSDIPLGADGPAYYNARKMVELIKKTEKKNKTTDINIMIASEDNQSTDILLNTILTLSSAIKNKWTDRQREIVFDCIEHGDNQVRAAERLGIGQSSVQKSLSNTDYYSYKKAMDTIADALAEIKVV